MSEQEVPLLAEYACNERGALPDGRRSCASWGNAVVSSVTAWPELLNKCLGGACATGDDTIRAPLLTARLALLGAVLFAVYSASASLVHKFSRPLLPGTDATERFLDAVVSQRPYGRQPTWSFLWSHEDGLMASPSICEIPAKGLLVATNDLVKEPTLLVHHSTDGGLSWRQVRTAGKRGLPC